MSAPRRRGPRVPDFAWVKASDDEKAAWTKKHPRTSYPYRVACRACGKRIWLSGIGVGSHRRACPGPTREDTTT